MGDALHRYKIILTNILTDSTNTFHTWNTKTGNESTKQTQIINYEEFIQTIWYPGWLCTNSITLVQNWKKE